MHLELLAKTDKDGGTCWDGNCPAVAKIHDGPGGYLVVGLPPDAEMLEALAVYPDIGIGDGEVVFWVPGPVGKVLLDSRRD